MISGFNIEEATTQKKKDLPRISGAEAVIRSFIEEGVETIFGYPGGAIIPVYDALYDYQDKLNHILVRHEQCALHAAQGYARASGRTGVCIVTSGPGATNTVTGLADAMLDSTPVVLISGQVASNTLGTDAFQEINFLEITQSVTKWNCQVKRAEDVPAAIAKAFYIAASGRPGPVVVDITKDAQNGMLDFDYQPVKFIRSYQPYREIDNDQILEAARLINLAKKPMALIGQGVILGGAENELKEFLEKSGIPAAATLLGLSALPSDHPQYVGMLGMHGNYGPNIKNRDCDLLIAIGMRFDDRVTGDASQFGINAKIIHLEIDPAEINKLVYADVPVIGDVKQTLPMLTEKVTKNDHTAWLNEFRVCYNIEREDIIEPAIARRGAHLRMGEVVDAVAQQFDDAILVTDVGQQQMFASRYFKFKQTRSIIT
ncbi:MAG: acetolactate synthase large subunit, partial [Alistipes sp.]|nr:acetolactate synthase large subunit [Alistipes sp.]